jgi:hypothetical protein
MIIFIKYFFLCICMLLLAPFLLVIEAISPYDLEADYDGPMHFK